MIILGIETSCDDTGIAIIETKNQNLKILANLISSQEKIHSPYGGVFPALAKREHQKNILPLLEKALKKSNLLNKKEKGPEDKKIKKINKILERNPELLEKLKLFLTKYEKPKIDKISITIGPGLEPCLWVGINLAKAISFYWDIEIIGTHHLEGHLLANFIDKELVSNFPIIGLIISGGNTQIILIKKIGDYKIIGETRDDAVGECFDKTARLLNLGYPGGKKISELAQKSKSNFFNIHLPRPMIHEKNLDFSFSGLKTAVLYETKKREKAILESIGYKEEISKELEKAIIEVLSKKIEKAIDQYQAKGLIIGGGVSANKEIRKKLKEIAKNRKIYFSAPKIKYSGDNAVMVAIISTMRNIKKTNWNKIKPTSNLKINGL